MSEEKVFYIYCPSCGKMLNRAQVGSRIIIRCHECDQMLKYSLLSTKNDEFSLSMESLPSKAEKTPA